MDVFGSLGELLSKIFRTSASNNEVTIKPQDNGVTQTIEFPESSQAADTLVSRQSTDQGASRMQNKDLDSATTRISDGINSAALPRTNTGSATVELPDVPDTQTDRLVARDTTDTLTNKTLTDPVLDGNASGTMVDTDLSAGPNTDDKLVSALAAQTYTDSVQTGLTDHINDTTDAHAASAITNTPNGAIIATDVQGAIDELDSEKVSKSGDSMSGTLDMGANPITDVSQLELEDSATIDTETSGGNIDIGGTNANEVQLGRSGQTTRIRGNLQVDGTTITQNVDTITSEDPNLELNTGGNQASANSEVAGFTVEMSDATNARLGYDSSLASRFKLGEVGSESEIVDVDSTQSLTNKTIDADSNSLSNIDDADIKALAGIAATKLADGSVDNVEFQRLGTAGTDAAGELVTTDGTQSLSSKTLESAVLNTAVSGSAVLDEDDLISDRDDALATQQSIKAYVDSVAGGGGSGSGSGEINYVPNPTFDLNTTDWFIYTASNLNPSDADIVEDLTANSTLTRDLVTPISGTASGLFNIDPSDGDVGIATEFTINRDYPIQKIKVSLYLQAEGDSQLRLADSAGLSVFLFAGGVQQIPASNVSVIPFLDMSTNSDSYGKWVGEFNISTSDTVFKLAIQSGGVGGGVATVKIDNVVVGEVLPQERLDSKGRLNYIQNGDFNRGNIGAHTVDIGVNPITSAGAADPTSADQLATRVELVPGTNSLSGSLKFDFNDEVGSKIGEGVAWDFEIPTGDATQLIQQPLEIDYLVQDNGTAHTLGDIKVYIKDLTSNDIVGEWDLDTTTTLTRLSFRKSWVPVVSANSKYRLIILVDSAVATLSDFAIDDVYIGPVSQVKGFSGGWRTYSHSNDFTITSDAAAVVSIVRGELTPRKNEQGTWLLSGQIALNHGSDTSFNVTIPGVTFKNITDFRQAIVTQEASASRARALPNTSNIQVNYASGASFTSLSLNDIELEEQPSWVSVDPIVNLINDSLITSNNYTTVSLTSNTNVNTNDPIPYDTVEGSRGGSMWNAVNSEMIIPADGTYEYSVNFRSVDNSVAVVQVDTGSGFVTDKQSIFGTNAASNLSNTLDLKKGDLVRVVHTTVVTRSYTADFNSFTLRRVPSVTAGSTVGFGLADGSNAGLIPSYQTATVELDNEFVGGERTVRITRIGNLVQITGLGVPTHAANPSPESTSGLIPEWARPVFRMENSHFQDLTNVGATFVETDGTIGCEYYTYSNTVANRGNTSSPVNISYTVEP